MTNYDRERMLELLAAAQLDELSVEERAELETLRESLDLDEPETLGALLLAIDRASPADALPDDLAERISATGRAIVAGPVAGTVTRRRNTPWVGLAIAAAVVAAISIGFAVLTANDRTRAERDWTAERQDLRERLDSNEILLAQSRNAVEDLRSDLAQAENLTEQQRIELARTDEMRLDYAERLARAAADLEATSDELDRARLTIAQYEAPADPAQLAQNRTKLLEVPGTIRVAWSPFEVPGLNPPEQPDVQGDVVWNDELQQGYLRFVGLDVNDPTSEQYQVWLIDERGMEQKVSGGVFNATRDGEVIVPIEPGIDVGRVALFAITVEDPGGIWVPNLDRRVVVAPREDG